MWRRSRSSGPGCAGITIPESTSGSRSRYHLGGLNAFQLLSPTALGGPADYFGDDNYWETVCSIGLVPLVAGGGRRRCDIPIAGSCAAGSCWRPRSVVFACGRSGGLYSLCFATVPGVRIDPRAGAVAVPGQPGRRGARGAWAGDATDQDGRPRRLAPARPAVRRGRAHRDWAVVRPPSRPNGRPRPSSRTGRPSRRSAPTVPPASGRTARAASRVLGDERFWFAMGGLSVLIVIGCRPIGVRGRRAVIGAVRAGCAGRTGLVWIRADRGCASGALRRSGSDQCGARAARCGD